MKNYEAYKNNKFDLSTFGLSHCGDDYTYFCTPVSADVFAAPGVDGIHYCMVDGFGDMVFAISPMNCPGEYVHPVAKNFDDFLRLLLVCDGNAAIEQCWQWSQEQFDSFMGEQEILPETREAAVLLTELTGLEPMELPYKYIRDLQMSFDYKSIPFREEYDKTVPVEEQKNRSEILCEQAATSWEVYYEDNFRASTHEDAPCEEISLEKHFLWAGREWYLPSVYTCEKGVVADILMRVDTAQVRAFMDKWSVTPENEYQFTSMQRRQMELENPLSFQFRTDLNINGKMLRNRCECSMAYIPFMDECNEEEWGQILDYYNLDPSCCWVIQRSSYPWEESKVDITTLEAAMHHQPMFVPGMTFETRAAGETHTFENPVTGLRHTLTVQEYDMQEMSFDFLDGKDREYPNNHIAMTFTLEPDMPQTEFSLTDSQESDTPRVIRNQTSNAGSSSAESINIIGGADGPTAIILGTPDSQGILHTAVSSFRFEPFDCVKWQLSFREKQMKEMTVKLI